MTNDAQMTRTGEAMDTFPTPEPIELRIRVGGGDVEVVAEPRADTTIDIRPSSSSGHDADAAEATRVEHHDGVVVVEVPKGGWLWGRNGSVSVRAAVPEGSRLRVTCESADVRCRGRLGATVVTGASGDVDIEVAGGLTVETASGDIAVDEVAGDARVSSASGDIVVRVVRGDVSAKTASGDLRLGLVEGSVTSKTASGDARVGAIVRGSSSFTSASGDVEVGIVEGTTAWLDVQSLSGDVRSGLDDADPPGDSAETVRLRVHTVSGDVSITRASEGVATWT
jgi:hypothetical protein